MLLSHSSPFGYFLSTGTNSYRSIGVEITVRRALCGSHAQFVYSQSVDIRQVTRPVQAWSVWFRLKVTANISCG